MKKIDRKKIAEKVAKILLEINGITLNPKKPYRYTSGILGPVYTDCRLLMGHPKERKIIIGLLLNLIQSTDNYDVIAGTATAGIPHAAWISHKLNKPMVYVRGKAKDHGKGNQIEGILKKNQKVAVIEDLISTGESSVQTVRAIRNAGAKSSNIFSIITYKMKKSEDNFKQNKVRLTSLTSFADVVSVAKKNKYIANEDQNILLEFIKDPPTWGKRMGFE
ncbi:MAG: orotate phosphoribosyltransferase [Candidatus Levyibacteriota bacterium]